MKSLIIEGTEDTPKIILDKDNGRFEITGRSLPEDSFEFFEPILEWIKNYETNPNNITTFVFKLDYTNTASSKFIHDILLAIKDIKKVSVKWYASEDDEDMIETGREFSEQVDIPFQFLTLKVK